MSSLHTLPRSTHRARRRGRGIAAGLGKSAGRGTKGQKARSGFNVPTGFEGGQTKLAMRLPKVRGEGNRPHSGRATVTLNALEQHYAAGERVSLVTLRSRGLIRPGTRRVRIVGTGKLTKSLKFAGVQFSGPVYNLLYGKKEVSSKR